MSDDTEAKLAAIDAQVEAQGVAAIKVKDGQVFYFSVEKLASLIQAAVESDSRHIAIFVKQSGQILMN